MQGSANVIILSINNVKDMELELPNIEKQKIIGEIYELGRQRDRLSKTILKKTSLVRNYLLMDFNSKGEK